MSKMVAEWDAGRMGRAQESLTFGVGVVPHQLHRRGQRCLQRSTNGPFMSIETGQRQTTHAFHLDGEADVVLRREELPHDHRLGGQLEHVLLQAMDDRLVHGAVEQE